MCNCWCNNKQWLNKDARYKNKNNFLKCFTEVLSWNMLLYNNSNKAVLMVYTYLLTLNLLTWRIWWAPTNASTWQIGFNSAFKGLIMDVRMITAYREWTSDEGGRENYRQHATTEPQENHDNSFVMTILRQATEQCYCNGKEVGYLIPPHPTSPCPYEVHN